jgi:hypothetical protein
MYSTPILFLIFNRPVQTQIVFEAIRYIKPQYLYIAADGPRASKHGEAEQCTATRKMVLDGIDWDCQVFTLFRDENLGCGKAVSGAITWFFENVEEGIILEDDCLPEKSFFYFCEELLTKYKNHEQIMHIGGSNFQRDNISSGNSYYFSNYIHIWGWATWRRAWRSYQLNIPPAIDDKFQYLLKTKFSNSFERTFWKNSFETVGQGKIDTWDTQWIYNIYNHTGIGITPTVNLISNIGFGADATHTTSFDNTVAEKPLKSITAIQHPNKIKINQKADKYTFKKLYENGNNHFNQIRFKIGQQFPWIKSLYLAAFGKQVKQ